MAKPTEIRKGKVIKYNGQPHLVLDAMHRTPGNLSGFVQVTMRNLSNGASTTNKFKSSETVEFCSTDNRNLSFSYVDEYGYHFLDNETFEDTVIDKSNLEDQKAFLVENNEYNIMFVNDKAVRVQLPAAIEMKVKIAPEAVRGDTASNVQKPITTESGLVVQVPLFIKAGEMIRVSTDDGSYLGRA